MVNYSTEIDALAVYAPDAFRDMILHPVDQFFDEDIRKINILFS
jgi:hypothetical protein